MKRAVLLVLGVALVVGPRGDAGGAKDKVHVVEKGELKIDGQVTKDDPRMTFKVDAGGKFFDVPMHTKLFRVKLKGGTEYTITVNAKEKEFDPFLALKDSGDKLLASDDDGGGGLNSKLTHKIAKDGEYKIYVGGLESIGNFTLRIAEARAEK